MATMIQKAADSAQESTSLDADSSQTPSPRTEPSDVMTDTPILFSFIDYLSARRGITREAALELVSNYMMARAAAHAEMMTHGPTTDPSPQNERATKH